MAQDDPWWLPGCVANIEQLKGVKCSEQHCTDAQNYSHAVCYCEPTFPNGCYPNRTEGCCSYSATSAIYVAQTNGGCYCCCGCFANETPVAISKTESKPINEIMVGDLVYVAEDSSLSKWGTKVVQFSSGTGKTSGSSIMIRVDFGPDEKAFESLYVTPNQIFYTPGAKLKRANRLVPGVDHLVRADGSPVAILQVTVGHFNKGIHHVATSQTSASSMAGHLILAKGIVCGDYALQINNNPELFVSGHHDLPEIGTKEYLAAYKHIPEITLHKASLLKKEVITDAGDDGISRTGDQGFVPFGSKGNASLPDNINYFISQKQAADILLNAEHWPVTSGVGADSYRYLVKLFQGFYPGIVFYLDNENELPNAYSFVEYGVSFIVVNGGLIRTKCVGFELLALIMAHEVGHLFSVDPKGKNGYTCEGMSDYLAVSSIFPYIWYGMYSFPYLKAALEQVNVFFSYINEDDRKGLLGNRCNFISIDCRLSALNAAANTQPLPFCAGGSPDPYLQVTGASAVQNGQRADVVISFNVQVNPETATALGNYSFEPKTAAFSAVVDLLDPAKVIVSAAVKPDIEYLVRVYNVLSATNEPLVAGKNTATFRLEVPQTAD